MKIVYCTNSICYLGGIERTTIVKANTLAEFSDIYVYIVVTDNKKDFRVHPLSPKVYLIDLDINYYQDDWKSQWHVLKGIFIKRKEHKKKLASILHQINPDVVISVGQSEKYLLPSIPGDWKKVREFHFTRDYRRRIAHSFFKKVIACISDYYESFYINKYDRIVTLTEEDREKNWQHNRKVIVIPNSCFSHSSGMAALDTKKIISVGRLCYQKNYVSLIRAFRMVAKKHPLWNLEIYGEGDQRGMLQALINEYSLKESVFLKGYSAQVEKEMLGASCFVLTSLFEGFGMVIVEAMSCGLPVVSYDCPCGPKDIITDGKDGFLVSVNNEDMLADRICFLIENEDKRKVMGQAAKEKAEKYKIGNIISQWLELFQDLKHETVVNR